MPRAVSIGLIVGWIVILAKCLATPMFITRWSIPIHPGWVIVPTLIFAGVVTFLALTHNWTRDNGD